MLTPPTLPHTPSPPASPVGSSSKMAQTYFTSSVPPAPRCLPEPLQKPSTWMSPALQPDIICSPEKVFCYRLVLSVCSLKGSFFPLLFLLQSKEFSCKLSLQQFSSTHKTEVNVIPPRNPTTQLQYLATHGQSCFNQTLTHFSPLPTLLCSRSLTAEDLYKQIRSSHFLAEKPTIASQGIESEALTSLGHSGHCLTTWMASSHSAPARRPFCSWTR